MPRLVGVLAGLVGGAIVGGLLVLHARSYAPALVSSLLTPAVAGEHLAIPFNVHRRWTRPPTLQQQILGSRKRTG
jgi:hypothetical protein